MKTINMIFFCLWFFCFFILLGDKYEEMRLSYSATLIMTIVLTGFLIAGVVAEIYITKKKA